jgi:hypothetical protein
MKTTHARRRPRGVDEGLACRPSLPRRPPPHRTAIVARCIGSHPASAPAGVGASEEPRLPNGGQPKGAAHGKSRAAFHPCAAAERTSCVAIRKAKKPSAWLASRFCRVRSCAPARSCAGTRSSARASFDPFTSRPSRGELGRRAGDACRDADRDACALAPTEPLAREGAPDPDP